MNRRSYYPHNQQIVSQMTATSSTGFISSRPETPNVTDSELANNHVDVRRNSFDSREINSRIDGLRIGDEFEYPMEGMPLSNTVNEKPQ